MKTSSSDREQKKKQAHRMVVQSDHELKRQSETRENDVFDHKTRNAILQNGEFRPPSGTLFEAIFQELKRKDQKEKNRHAFSSIVSRLHTRNKPR